MGANAKILSSFRSVNVSPIWTGIEKKNVFGNTEDATIVKKYTAPVFPALLYLDIYDLTLSHPPQSLFP